MGKRKEDKNKASKKNGTKLIEHKKREVGKIEVVQSQTKVTKRKASLNSEASNHSNRNGNKPSENELQKAFASKLNDIDTRLNLDKDQIKLAILVLQKLLADAESENVFSIKEEQPILINFTLAKLPESYSLRPVSLPIRSALNKRVCIFVKDPIEKFNELNVFPKGVDCNFSLSAISYSELLQDFHNYQERRNLVKQYDLFLCDHKIYMMLRKALGKAFYDAKKYPIAVPIDYSNAATTESSIRNVVENRVFYMSNGPNYTVKGGSLAGDVQDLTQDVLDTVRFTLAHILKWGVDLESLRSISLKFTNSLELPVFNQLSQEEIEAFHSQETQKVSKSDKVGKVAKQAKSAAKEKELKEAKAGKTEKKKKKGSK